MGRQNSSLKPNPGRRKAAGQQAAYFSRRTSLKRNLGNKHLYGKLFFSLFAAVVMGVFGLGVFAATSDAGPLTTTITNGIRYDTEGNRIDAHDGQIRVFNGKYYWYGTAYDCGYAFSLTNKVFCGFRAYSSTDMVHWKNEGLLFDPLSTSERGTNWQKACGIEGNGCYRVAVVYNPTLKKYVSWINSYDNGPTTQNGTYHVFTSDSPVGGFKETARPTLPATDMGDDTIFIDTDDPGCASDPTAKTCPAYLAYAATTRGYDLAIVRLNDTYTSTVGPELRMGIQNSEAPALFKANNRFYLMFGQRNCAYCGGTGLKYLTTSIGAASPMASWPTKPVPTSISADSNGGQPTAVSVIPSDDHGGKTYLQQTDQWVGTPMTDQVNGTIDGGVALNQSLATQQWSPLSFDANGAVKPLPNLMNFSLNLAHGTTSLNKAPNSSTFVALPSPRRLTDTRAGSGFPQANAPAVAGSKMSLKVAGAAGVPDGATAVTLNVTTVNSSADSYIVALPGGANMRPTSALNFSAGKIVAGSVTVPVGPDGNIDIYVGSGKTDIVIDAAGYFMAGKQDSRYVPLTSASRALDTRSAGGPIGPGQQRSISLAGTGVPLDATAVVVNLTTTEGTQPSFFSLTPAPTSAPETSSINFEAKQTVANRAVVPLKGNTIYLFNRNGNAHAIVDVNGYYTKNDSGAGLVFHPLASRRLIDSRTYVGAAISATPYQFPAGNMAVALLNVAVTNTTQPSFVRVWPKDKPIPPTSDMNFLAGQTTSNQVISPTDGGRAGMMYIQNWNGTANFIVDIQGWYGRE